MEHETIRNETFCLFKILKYGFEKTGKHILELAKDLIKIMNLNLFESSNICWPESIPGSYGFSVLSTQFIPGICTGTGIGNYMN